MDGHVAHFGADGHHMGWSEGDANPRGANVRVLDSGVGLANATLQQRLTAVRLYYDYLVEEGVRDGNPAGRGRYTPGRVVGGAR